MPKHVLQHCPLEAIIDRRKHILIFNG